MMLGERQKNPYNNIGMFIARRVRGELHNQQFGF